MTRSSSPRRRSIFIGGGVALGTVLLITTALVVHAVVVVPLNRAVVDSVNRFRAAVEELRPAPRPTSEKDWPDSFFDNGDDDDGDSADGCEDTYLDCVVLSVPRDHSDPEGGGEMTVTFGIQPAYGEREGALVIAVGGPGTPALDSAQYYTPMFDAVAESYDLVFFDQRGIDQAGRIGCREATREHSGVWDIPDMAAGDESTLQDARVFAADCAAEAGVTEENAHHFASWQSAGDIEAFRRHIGDEQLSIYAESYGTLTAQAYAAAHPDHLAALILDGPIDPAESLQVDVLGRTAAFHEVWEQVLTECADDASCASDFPDGDPMAAYDAVLARTAAGDAVFEFPGDDGEGFEEEIGLGELRSATNSYIYHPYDRMQLLRGIADAARADYVLLARLTGATVFEPDYPLTSPDNGSFFAITCADLAIPPGDDEAAAREYIAAGEAAGVPSWRSGALYYFMLPCNFWPRSSVAPPEPASAEAGSYPTLILSATADPATPHDDARRLFERGENTYLVAMQTGGHVLMSDEDPCVTEIVFDLLLEGHTPESRESRCEGELYETYRPTLRASLADYPHALEAMIAVHTHIRLLPEYAYWPDGFEREVACDHGGTMEMTVETDVELEFRDCTFLEGLTFTEGSGRLENNGELSLDVELPNGQLEYDRTLLGSTLQGTLDGEEIDAPD